MLATVLPRNAVRLGWAVHKSSQAVYQVRVRRLETSSRRRLVAVVYAPGLVAINAIQG